MVQNLLNQPECDNCNELIIKNIELEEQVKNLQDIIKALGKELKQAVESDLHC